MRNSHTEQHEANDERGSARVRGGPFSSPSVTPDAHPSNMIPASAPVDVNPEQVGAEKVRVAERHTDNMQRRPGRKPKREEFRVCGHGRHDVVADEGSGLIAKSCRDCPVAWLEVTVTV